MLDIHEGQFFCPICRQLSNALVPIPDLSRAFGSDRVFSEALPSQRVLGTDRSSDRDPEAESSSDEDTETDAEQKKSSLSVVQKRTTRRLECVPRAIRNQYAIASIWWLAATALCHLRSELWLTPPPESISNEHNSREGTQLHNANTGKHEVASVLRRHRTSLLNTVLFLANLSRSVPVKYYSNLHRRLLRNELLLFECAESSIERSGIMHNNENVNAYSLQTEYIYCMQNEALPILIYDSLSLFHQIYLPVLSRSVCDYVKDAKESFNIVVQHTISHVILKATLASLFANPSWMLELQEFINGHDSVNPLLSEIMELAQWVLHGTTKTSGTNRSSVQKIQFQQFICDQQSQSHAIELIKYDNNQKEIFINFLKIYSGISAFKRFRMNLYWEKIISIPFPRAFLLSDPNVMQGKR